MKKFTSMAVSALALATVLFSAPVLAAPVGVIEGGNIYYARNVSKNTAFGDPATADKCEVVQFRVRVHNPGPNDLTNVNIKATLPTAAAASHSSQVTVTAANAAEPSTITDTATVNLSQSLALSYVPGSTELLDANAAKISTLSDTIFTSGVSIDTIGVSIQQKRFVQFSVKTSCPEVPKNECKPGIPVGDVRCQEKPETPKTPETPKQETPAVLPSTGPEAAVAGLFGSSALGLGVHSFLQSRRALKNAKKQ